MLLVKWKQQVFTENFCYCHSNHSLASSTNTWNFQCTIISFVASQTAAQNLFFVWLGSLRNKNFFYVSTHSRHNMEQQQQHIQQCITICSEFQRISFNWSTVLWVDMNVARFTTMTDDDVCYKCEQILLYSPKPLTLIFMNTHQTPAWSKTEKRWCKNEESKRSFETKLFVMRWAFTSIFVLVFQCCTMSLITFLRVESFFLLYLHGL